MITGGKKKKIRHLKQMVYFLSKKKTKENKKAITKVSYVPDI